MFQRFSTHLLGLVGLLAVGCTHASMIGTQTMPSAQTASSGPAYHIAYRLRIANPDEHRYEVEMQVSNVSGNAVELQLPVWSPGRYAPFFFARNLTGLSVTSGARELAVERENGSLWRVNTAGMSAFTVRYRVFANTLSGTFSVLDSAHANWNGPSLFMYVVGHKPDAVTLHIDAPAGWHIVNGDAAAPDQADYTFENYDRLADTPTEVSPHIQLDSMSIDGRVYRAMIHHNGPTTAAERERFLGDLRKIVTYENTVFDPPPLHMYTFLFNIGYPGGDGMEHLFSTQIIDRNAWTENADVLPGIGTAAHEYFHVWNMKRVRAAALGPFDYTRPVYQPSLWVGEGWTQYYGMVALPRSGVTSVEQIYSVAASLIQSNLNAPGRKNVSARMSSFEAPFFDGAQAGYAVDPAAFFSYYTKGAGIALYLDLFIREQTHGAKSLDDAFRLLRDRTWGAPNASYYLQGRGYTESDVEHAVSDAAGVDMHVWFEQHVGGTEDMDYNAVLAPAGLRLVMTDARRYAVEPIENPTPEQLRIRQDWMRGVVTKAAAH